MSMMSSGGAHAGYVAGAALHGLFGLLFAIGLLFLIVWAVKTLSPAKLKQWGLGLLLVGLLGCILTVSFVFAGWKGMDRGKMMSKGGMMEMMQGKNRPDTQMGNMSMMLSGKTGDAFDEAFIDMMIPHHEGAIDMAEMALEAAGHQEIKDLANDIIAAQQREIDMMRGWEKEWGYAE